jgi:hypothetical protein
MKNGITPYSNGDDETAAVRWQTFLRLVIRYPPMLTRVSAVSAVALLAGCSSLPPAARPGVVAAGAVVAASVLFYIGAKDDGSSAAPEDVGCFDRIEGNSRQTICPP